MQVPWITYEANRFLNYIIKPTMRVFEWGAGASTLYFCKHAASVVSIENDKVWLGNVAQNLRSLGLTNCELHLIEAEAGRITVNKDPYWPDNFFQPDVKNEFINSNFRHYACAIDRFPDEHFDIVMVDGVARGGCMKHAAPKLKTGGYLIWDNSDRLYDNKYTVGLFREWDRVVFWGYGPINDYKWETTIWRKLKEKMP